MSDLSDESTTAYKYLPTTTLTKSTPLSTYLPTTTLTKSTPLSTYLPTTTQTQSSQTSFITTKVTTRLSSSAMHFTTSILGGRTTQKTTSNPYVSTPVVFVSSAVSALLNTGTFRHLF